MPEEKTPPAADYKVGFGKPPKHTQFRPGQSGNPKGRKKGTRNLKTIVDEELQSSVVIRVGDAQRKMTKQQAIVVKVIHDAMTGKANALRQAIDLMLRFYGANNDESENRPLTAQDHEFLEFLQKRFDKKAS